MNSPITAPCGKTHRPRGLGIHIRKCAKCLAIMGERWYCAGCDTFKPNRDFYNRKGNPTSPCKVCRKVRSPIDNDYDAEFDSLAHGGW